MVCAVVCSVVIVVLVGRDVFIVIVSLWLARPSTVMVRS